MLYIYGMVLNLIDVLIYNTHIFLVPLEHGCKAKQRAGTLWEIKTQFVFFYQVF